MSISYHDFRSAAIYAIKSSLDVTTAYRLQHGQALDIEGFQKVVEQYMLPLASQKMDEKIDFRRVTLFDLFRTVIMSITKQCDDTNEEFYAQMFDTFDLILTCSEHRDFEIFDNIIPMSVIEDTLELQTVLTTERLWRYLESRSKRLTANLVPNKGKALVLLRLCNELLRRLSKTKNTALCGRILVFSASAFPLSEISGVNKTGAFNTENVVEYEKDIGMDEEDEERKFYHVFWGLQEFFRDPLLCFKDGQARFEDLRKKVDETIAHFVTVTTREMEMAGSKAKEQQDWKSGRKRKHLDSDGSPAPDNNKEEFFFPGFLTSPGLLELEVADTNFRREILLQVLILLQYLQTYTPAKRDELVKVANAAFRPKEQTLDAEKEAWVKDTKKKVVDELKLTGTGGKKFAETANVVLEREEGWFRWKVDNFPTYERDPLKNDAWEACRIKKKKMMAPNRPYPHAMGTRELTRLWRHLDDLKERGLNSQPKDLQEFLGDCRDMQFDDEREWSNRGGVTDDEKKEVQQARIWRGLRLAAREKLHLFRELTGEKDAETGETDLLMRLERARERDERGGEVSEAIKEGETKDEEMVEAVEEDEKESEQEPELESEVEPESKTENEEAFTEADSEAVIPEVSTQEAEITKDKVELGNQPISQIPSQIKENVNVNPDPKKAGSDNDVHMSLSQTSLSQNSLMEVD